MCLHCTVIIVLNDWWLKVSDNLPSDRQSLRQRPRVPAASSARCASSSTSYGQSIASLHVLHVPTSDEIKYRHVDVKQSIAFVSSGVVPTLVTIG